MRQQAYTFVIATIGATIGLWANGASAKAEEAHAFLGVMVVAGQGEHGVMIQDVAPDSPAAKAGIKAGDRVVKVGNQDAKDVDGFLKAVGSHKPGDKVTLTVNRDGKDQKLTATLGQRPEPTARRPEQPTARRPEQPGGNEARGPAFLGINVQALTPELRKQLKFEGQNGVEVAEVVPKSPAEKAGLKREDIITAVTGRAVKSPEELHAAIQESGAGKELKLEINRGGKEMTVKATPRAGAFGQFLTPGDDRFPSVDVASMIDESRRIQDLERRVSDLEKKVRDLEKRR